MKLKTLKDIPNKIFTTSSLDPCYVKVSLLRRELIKWIKSHNDELIYSIDSSIERMPTRPWEKKFAEEQRDFVTHAESCVRDANANAIKEFIKHFLNIKEKDLK